MTIPLRNVVGASVIGEGGRASAPPEQIGSIERVPSSPPPLPQTTLAAPELVAAAPADASAAPAESGPASGAGARRSWGFTSVIRHLSLRGWLRWIQSNRADAALRIRTPDGSSGSIWCTGGKVIDAEWGKLEAEEALRQMLRFTSGAVTIDFAPFDRPRRLGSPVGPLQGQAAGLSCVGDQSRAQAEGPSAPPGASRLQPARRAISRVAYLAGGVSLAALVVAAFGFGRIRAANDGEYVRGPEPERAEQIKSGLLPPPARAAVAAASGELPVLPFVAIEVEPAHAEIWLDRLLVGRGRIELGPFPEGLMHELRFVASGYETRSLFFDDMAPAGRVLLERRVEPTEPPSQPALAASAGEGSQAAVAADESDGTSAVQNAAGQREVVRRVTRRRAAAAVAAPARPAAQPAQPKNPPQVQLIEARTPRVQVID